MNALWMGYVIIFLHSQAVGAVPLIYRYYSTPEYLHIVVRVVVFRLFISSRSFGHGICYYFLLIISLVLSSFFVLTFYSLPNLPWFDTFVALCFLFRRYTFCPMGILHRRGSWQSVFCCCCRSLRPRHLYLSRGKYHQWGGLLIWMAIRVEIMDWMWRPSQMHTISLLVVVSFRFSCLFFSFRWYLCAFPNLPWFVYLISSFE